MRFLVIRLSSFGDVILTTPVLEEIKNKYPDSEIDFVVMDSFKDAIKGNPYIDNLIIFEKNEYKGILGIYRFARKLKKKYDYIIDLHSKQRSILISILVSGNVLRYKKRSFWKTILVKMRIIKYKVDDTIIKNYFGALKNIGVEYKGENLLFNFSDSDLEKMKKYENYVVFAPGASKNTKKWPIAYFGMLGQMLEEENIVLIGGKNEYDELEKIKDTVGERCKNLAGKLSLKESGALISRAKYIVTNDSGPFHIARGVNTPSFVIFGPTDYNMFKYEKKETLICANESCSPCSLHGDRECPKGHFNCMKKLTPVIVYKKIMEKLEKSNA